MATELVACGTRACAENLGAGIGIGTHPLTHEMQKNRVAAHVGDVGGIQSSPPGGQHPSARGRKKSRTPEAASGSPGCHDLWTAARV